MSAAGTAADQDDGGPSAADDRPADDRVPAVDQASDHAPAESEGGVAPDPDTGNPRVDEAVERLIELDTLPTADHAAVYEDVHRRLHSALTELDSE